MRITKPSERPRHASASILYREPAIGFRLTLAGRFAPIADIR